MKAHWILLACLPVTVVCATGQTVGKLKKQEPKEWAEPGKENIIKINFLSPIFETITLFYQRHLTDDKSFQIGLGYMDFNGFNGSDKNKQTGSTSSTKYNFSEHTTGIFITPEYRLLLSGNQMQGFFVAPFLRYSYLKYTEDYEKDTAYTYYSVPSGQPKQKVNEHYTYHSAGLGIVLGQQFIFRNKVSLEYFGGPVFSVLMSSSGTMTKKDDVVISDGFASTVFVRGYGFRAGVSVGFLF